MSLRVLSGVLVTKDAAEGSAVIEFRNNSLAGGHTPGVRIDRTYSVGDPMPADGKFRGKPAFTLALRELKVVETEWVAGRSAHEGKEYENFRVNNGTLTETTMEIEWVSKGGSMIEEISYMIIGDV